MSPTVEAKAICIKHLEDMLIDPMFTIFHVQHSQIEARTGSDSDLLHHFKTSMSKVKTWNSTVVKDFCSSLPVRFPQLVEFERLFFELQDIMCNIMNESSVSNAYSPIREEVHNILHEFVSSCSDAFIGNLEWFSCEEDSSEFQLSKNNAKTTMQQTTMVENVAMKFIKASPKDDAKLSDSDSSNSGSGSGSDSESDSEEEKEKDKENDSENGDEDEEVKSKQIDLKTGSCIGGEDNNMIGKFSTFNVENKKKGDDSDNDNSSSSSVKRKRSDSESDDESSDESSGDEDESSGDEDESSGDEDESSGDEDESSDDESDDGDYESSDESDDDDDESDDDDDESESSDYESSDDDSSDDDSSDDTTDDSSDESSSDGSTTTDSTEFDSETDDDSLNESDPDLLIRFDSDSEYSSGSISSN